MRKDAFKLGSGFKKFGLRNTPWWTLSPYFGTQDQRTPIGPKLECWVLKLGRVISTNWDQQDLAGKWCHISATSCVILWTVWKSQFFITNIIIEDFHFIFVDFKPV